MTRPALALAKPEASTRVGNGSALLAGIDGRTTGARRYREILTVLKAELEIELFKWKEHVSEQQMLLLRRAALLTMWCEDTEARMVNGGDIDISAFTAATNSLRRLLNDAGLIWPADIRLKK